MNLSRNINPCLLRNSHIVRRTCFLQPVPGSKRFNSTSNGKPEFPKGDLKKHIISQYKNSIPHFEIDLPAWQKMLGENFIKTFAIDMDKVRSGPVGGRVFRDLCKEQAFYSEEKPLSPRANFYYKTLGLPQTFQQWFQVDALHIWMLYVRMRAMPRKYCREFQRKMINSVFEEIGYRLRQDVKVPSDRAINTYKKQFHDQLRGAIFSYDEGVYTSDAVLAAALWRNLFGSNKEVNMSHLEQMVHYVRTQLWVLERVSDRDFSYGKFGFIEPYYRYDSLSEQDELDIKKIAEECRNTERYDQSKLSTEGW